MPAIRPPAWISRCAGVQNESRPIDMCHEMSQYTPTITHAAANTAVYACQPSTPTTAVADARVDECLSWLDRDGHESHLLEKTHLLAELFGLDDGLAEAAAGARAPTPANARRNGC